jgi:hypothetical protein
MWVLWSFARTSALGAPELVASPPARRRRHPTRQALLVDDDDDDLEKAKGDQ